MARRTAFQIIRNTLARLTTKVDWIEWKFEQAQMRIQTVLFEAVTSEKLWRLRERRQQSALAQKILREVFRETEDVIQQSIADHFQLGQQAASHQIQASLLQSDAQRAALSLLREQASGEMRNAELLIGRRVNDVFRKQGMKQALEQGLTGSITNATKSAVEALQKEGVTAFVDRSGRRWTLQHYTSMAIQTTTMQALNTATQLTLVERGFDVVSINSVADPCKICLPYNGKEFSLTGRTEGLEVLRVLPPFHGSCRHFVYPTARTLSSQQEELEVA